MIDHRTAVEAREGREECLEALYRLERAEQATTWQALRNNPDLARIDIPNTLLDLVERGEVLISDGAVVLRPSGRTLGRRIYRRHELVERFFRILGLKRERAHNEACRLEHVMALPGERMNGLSEQDELSLVIDLFGQGAIPLTHGVRGVPYRLGMICGGRGIRRKLEDMGVSGGTDITLCSHQRGGPVEISVRGSRLALGRGVASRVLVIPSAEGEGPGFERYRHTGHGAHHWMRNHGKRFHHHGRPDHHRHHG